MKGLLRSMTRGSPQRQAIRRQRVPVKNVALVSSGASGDGFGTVVIGDLPQGNIAIIAGAAYLQFTGSSAGTTTTWTGAYSIGTTPTADATLNSTDANLIGSSTISAATAKVSPVTRGVNATAAMVDNTDDSLEVNLNFKIDDATVSADTQNFVVNGVVDLVYSVLLDD